MIKRYILILILSISVFSRLPMVSYAVTSSGASIESHAEMFYGDSGVVTSETTITTIEQVYGITMEPVSRAGYNIPGATCYLHVSLSNLGNGTDLVHFYHKASTPEAWTYSLISDDNGNCTHEAGENTPLDDPLPISEEGERCFFIAVTVPSTETTGTTGGSILVATGEGRDGSYYTGANGTIYGGPDSVEATITVTTEYLSNLRINRDDSTNKIYISWNGGSADIYCINGTFEAAPSAYSLEASNVVSPYYCASIEAKDGKIRYYKVALAGTSAYSTQTFGKYDIPVSVGINQLSSPLVIYENDPRHIVGSQVTGAQNASAADRIWTYNPYVQGQFDISWLVGGVGVPYDGMWYTGNSPTMDKVGTDEGWYLQIREGHSATYVTMIGEVSSTNRAIPITIGMNLVGSCFPVQITLEGSNLWGSGMTGSSNAPSADRLWTYNPAVQGEFYIAWLIDGIGPAYDGKWFTGNSPTTMQLTPGKGFWIQVRPGHGPFTWNYIKQY